jgi:hypothetical protein
MNRSRKYAPVSLPNDYPSFKPPRPPSSYQVHGDLQTNNDPSKFGIGYDSRSSSLNHSPLTTPGNSRRQSFETKGKSSINTDNVFQAGLGLIGAATAAAPVLAPVAAAAGIGYGIYKLGESFSLW